MAKEYNAEELAIMQSMQGGEGSAGGGQDANGASEIDKLKLMPGYEKIHVVPAWPLFSSKMFRESHLSSTRN